MKRYFITVALAGIVNFCSAQTNIFPASGYAGIGVTTPTVALQLGTLNADVTGKQIMIPGTYNFEKLQLGHIGNGNMALEMVNHTGTTTSYGARIMTNVDNGGSGLQFQFATPQSSYDALDYQTRVFMSVNGNMGIGTITPSEKLVVNGNMGIVDGGSLHFLPSTATPWANTKVLNRNWDGQDFIELLVPGHGANTAKLRMNADGNVGIGTTTPNAKLAVNGNIRAKEIKVETANWPDYVFAKEYKLPSLAETAQHIKDKGHLPGIPSAKEAEANGVELGEMNKRLLQKIEELTLHLIEKDKEIMDLKKVQSRVEKLEAIIENLQKGN